MMSLVESWKVGEGRNVVEDGGMNGTVLVLLCWRGVGDDSFPSKYHSRAKPGLKYDHTKYIHI